jgi:hypothetical protein
MSLEQKIEALTAAVVALTNKLESSNVAPAAPVAQVAAPVAQVPQMPAPVLENIPAPAGTMPVMPAMPNFAAPVAAVAAPVASGAPFNDGPGLIQYVMNVYKEIGATKGAMIQNVLAGLGYQNINDVKPEHYGALFTGVESLKG